MATTPSNAPRIYLDQAATSWPKSPAVLAAISDFYQRHGTAVGRGSYAEADWLAQRIRGLRGLLAQVIGAEYPEEIVWAFNGTDALNLAIIGSLRPGDHVVTSEAEHNSVLRPLDYLQRERGVSVTIVPCRDDGSLDPAAIVAALRPTTSLVCLTAASNVTGAVNDLAPLGSACRAHGRASLCIDAAQAIGYLPLDVRSLHCDLLAAPGHKGLGGPLGTGFLYIRRACWDRVQPIRWGGTGTASHEMRQPETVPEKFESGNLDGGGLLGLYAALQERHPHGGLSADWRTTPLFTRFQRCCEELRGIPGLQLFASRDPQASVPVASFTLRGCDSREVATLLDAYWKIECRAGLHCAPLIAARLGTLASGGTVRLSPGAAISDAQLATVVAAVRTLSGTLAK